MNDNQTASKNEWQKSPVPNLVRFVTSKVYFGRIRVKGKLIRRSLKTKTLSVAKLRLADLEKTERQMTERALAFDEGKMLFADELAIFRQRLHGEGFIGHRDSVRCEEREMALEQITAGPRRPAAVRRTAFPV